MKKNYLITVIDGQGGGMGRQIVEKLTNQLSHYQEQYTLRALGTNSAATSKMIRAGANDGATGENAIVWNVKKADIIIGVIGILIPNSILGELSPAMAEAISNSEATKILIPIHKCGCTIALPYDISLSQCIEKSAELVEETLKQWIEN